MRSLKPLCRRTTIFVLLLLPVLTFAASKEGIPTDANDIRPILVSQTIPDVTLTDINGKSVSLKQLTQKQPTLLIFYRGSWCPYCNAHLGQLAKIEPQLIKMGIQIVAISPDKPDFLRKSIEKHSLQYTLLSDSKMKAARAFGLAYQLAPKTVEKYRGYGIDLEKQSGESHYMLPVPAALLITTKGTVTFSFVAPNYKVRADSKVLLAAAEHLLTVD